MVERVPAIEIEDLTVVYKRGLGRRDLVAVDGLKLHVNPGEVVGFIGPNGAGKSTTIKTLMGFILPTNGRVRVLGAEAGSIEAKRRTGYLPEVALYYPFMKASEILTMYGQLMGMQGQTLRETVQEILGLVGLEEWATVQLKKFSKGMLQRIGIGQAIMGNPDLLILDEVTSGLDPVGRRDLREILLRFKHDGKTIFFSSHELSEVALICDRIIIIDAGKVIEEKCIGDLLLSLNKFHLIFKSEALPDDFSFPCKQIKADLYRIDIREDDKPVDILRRLIEANYEIVEFASDSLSLEDYFVNVVGRKVT